MPPILPSAAQVARPVAAVPGTAASGERLQRGMRMEMEKGSITDSLQRKHLTRSNINSFLSRLSYSRYFFTKMKPLWSSLVSATKSTQFCPHLREICLFPHLFFLQTICCSTGKAERWKGEKTPANGDQTEAGSSDRNPCPTAFVPAPAGTQDRNPTRKARGRGWRRCMCIGQR